MEEIPTEAPISIEAPPKRRQILTKNMKWAIGLGVAATMVALYILRSPTAPEGAVKTRALAPVNQRELDKVGGSGSEEYKRQMERHTEQQIEDAARSGNTYVVPPNVSGKPSVSLGKAEEIKPQTQSGRVSMSTAASAPAPRAARRQQKGDPQMTAYLNGLNGRLDRESGAQLVQVLNPAGAGMPKQVPQVASAENQETAADLQPGDILYAINAVTLDSDSPGPIMARIVSGKYKGAKAIGRFQRTEENLVLEFTSLTTSGGVTYKIQGYAIDPRTDKTAVRSSVDTHFLERWGGLIAASFLEGFADAVSNSGRTTYNGVYGSSSTTPHYDINEQLLIAGGKVGQRSANIFEKHFDRPPTVSLRSGTELGILIIDASAKNDRKASVPGRNSR